MILFKYYSFKEKTTSHAVKSEDRLEFINKNNHITPLVSDSDDLMLDSNLCHVKQDPVSIVLLDKMS